MNPPEVRAPTAPETTAPLWVPEHDYLPAEDRSVIRALRTSPGVTGDLDFATGPTVPPSWNVLVYPGRAILDGNVSPWTQGSYVCYSPEERVIPVRPSDPSLDRIDVVVLHVHDQDSSTEEGYSWSREIVEGVPGSGVPPELPPNTLAIAALRINAGDAAITADSFIHPAHILRPDLRKQTGPILYFASGPIHHVHWPDALGYSTVHQFDLEPGSAWGGPHAGEAALASGGLGRWPFPVVLEVDLWLWVGNSDTPSQHAWTWRSQYGNPSQWIEHTNGLLHLSYWSMTSIAFKETVLYDVDSLKYGWWELIWQCAVGCYIWGMWHAKVWPYQAGTYLHVG